MPQSDVIAAHPCQQGFSLPELLVALAVAAIVLSIAIPSFTRLMVSNRLTGTVNEVISSMNAARLEAIKRNNLAQFCGASDSANGGDTLGDRCQAIATRVVALASDGTTTNTVRSAIALPANIMLGNGSNGGAALAAIRYSGNGLAYSPGSTNPYSGLVSDVFSTRITSDNHRCLYIGAGSVISNCIVTSTTGGCPTSEPTNCQK